MEILISADNNQLLCFDPLSENWKNPQTFGTVPKPRADHGTAAIADKVWLYGGCDYTYDTYDELFRLDMTSLTWTEIQIQQFKPPCRHTCSLSAVTEHHLVLHGGLSGLTECLDDTWILDLQSLSWKEHSAGSDHPRSHHTGTVGVSSSTLIIGGCEPDNILWDDEDDEDEGEGETIYHNDVFSVRLEPKSLQHLAMLTVYNHRNMLPWKRLPKKLITRFLFPVRDTIASDYFTIWTWSQW